MLIYEKDNILKIKNKMDKSYQVLETFDKVVIIFFNDLYKLLNKKKIINAYPELLFLKFWLRPGNLNLIYKNSFDKLNFRARLGCIFHIAPSNTPLNFFYSLFFGLVAGNINIVRLPSKDYDSLKIFLSCLKKIISKKKFKIISDHIFFVKYEKSLKYTEYLSGFCDMRVIWGGDNTINSIRKIPINPKTREITFPDRVSIAILDLKKYKFLNIVEKQKLIKKFYGDLFFVDQNACTSPQIIFWVNGFSENVRNDFWERIEDHAKKKYDLPEIATLDKLNKFYEDSLNLNISNKINLHSLCYRLNIKKFPRNIDSLKGRWGYFYEFNLKKINNLNLILHSKMQTCVYFGITKKEILDVVMKNKSNAIDRIVPVGQAHNFDGYWDGYDLFKSMTRIIRSN